jgi:hypothetical protein
MSSWSSLANTKTKAIYGFKPTTGGICSNLNQLLFSYLFCRKKQVPLYVLDHPNCVSDTFPMFQGTLEPISGLSYVYEFPKGTKVLEHKHIHSTLSVLTNDDFKAAAKRLFTFLPAAKERIASEIPVEISSTAFDIGLHIRSGDKITQGEMQSISIDVYRAALLNCRIDNPKIFVMTDNTDLLTRLKDACPSTWSWASMDEGSSGHVQSHFNEQSQEKKEREFYRFMAELSIMQKIPTLLVTYSSNVGRYLYLVCPSTTNPLSLDLPHWTF